MTIITQASLSEWKEHVVTQVMMDYLKQSKLELMEGWANGEVINDPIMNAKWLGTIECIDKLLFFNPVTEDKKEMDHE